MVRANLKHLTFTSKTLATGERVRYWRHRLSKEPLGKTADVSSPPADVVAKYAEADKRWREQRNRVRADNVATLNKSFLGSAEAGSLRESTRKEYKRLLAAVDVEFGSMPIDVFMDVRDSKKARGEFLAYRDRLAKEGKLREAENRLTVFARVFSWAVDRGGLIDFNPLESWRRTYDADRSELIWTPDKIEAFLAVAPKEMVLALYLAVYTGQRQGDLLRLTWTNYRDGKLYLKQSKGQRHVTVPCIDRLRTMLDELRDGGDLRSTHILVSSRKRPWKKRHFSAVFKMTSDLAGVTDLTFHDLRGTAVTLLADAGCTEAEIASITGHTLQSVSRILERYLSRTPAQSESAMRKLEEHLRTGFANQSANRAGGD